MNTNTLRIAAATIAVLLLTPTTGLTRGACDGFHRCRCGVEAARNTGLPLNYNGYNLKRAVDWKHALPQTSARPGAVMYQTGGGPSGHVSVIQQVTGTCTAIVKDDAGTYERNICIRNAVYLDPGGTTTISLHTYSAKTKQKRGKRHQQIAYSQPTDDRFGLSNAH